MKRRPPAAEGSAPLPNSYWVEPGRLLAGEHPGGRSADETRRRVARLLDAGIDYFVDLTQRDERPAYDGELPFRAEYVRLPIRDHGLPAQPAEMSAIVDTIERALQDDRRVYVHCRAGIGRTGMAIACLLIARGLKPDDALYELNRLWQKCGRAKDWPHVPETDEQIEYVRNWPPVGGEVIASRSVSSRPASGVAPSAAGRQSEPARFSYAAGSQRDRYHGALLGLAIGDSLAAGGGQLAPWTDDTAMALCLAESLLESNGFDPLDQVNRYALWQQNGHLSATGSAVGITASTARALAMAQWRRQMFSGSHDPNQLDAEPLSRVAPPTLYFFRNREDALREASDAARTTCQAPLVLDACRLLAALLHAALSARPKSEVLAAGAELVERGELRLPVRDVAEGVWPSTDQAATAPAVLGWALQVFAATETFERGALRAAASPVAPDVVASTYGQLAGAFYGAAAIPDAWRKSLIQQDLIAGFAERLYEHAFRGA